MHCATPIHNSSKYSIKQHKSVNQFIEALPLHAAAKVFAAFKKLEEFGLKCNFPMLRILRDGIWELRISYKGTAYRYLFTVRNCEIWITNVYQKQTKATPRRMIELAKSRAQGIITSASM